MDTSVLKAVVGINRSTIAQHVLCSRSAEMVSGGWRPKCLMIIFINMKEQLDYFLYRMFVLSHKAGHRSGVFDDSKA